MTVNEFISEFKADNSASDSQNLIDELSIYNWLLFAMRQFGANIMTLCEDVVQVKKNRATLPDNFCQLYIAYLCNPKGYHVDPKDRAVVQNSFQWTERIERSSKWNSCDPCCKQEEEKIITERVMMDTCPVEFYYECPTSLCLGKSMKKNACHAKCRNLIVRDNPNEITINEKTLYANFKEGSIYYQYYGLPIDEEGVLYIPDVGKNTLIEYLRYYVSMRFYERLLANKDDTNVTTLFNYYVRKEEDFRGRALTDTKFSKLTPKSFRRLKAKNRAEMLKFECNFPTV